MTTIARLEQDEHRLHDLRIDEWSDLVLAGLAMGCALAATYLHPPFALPLFVGAVTALALCVRAFLRRQDLVDRLLLDEDAYAILEIRRRGEELVSMKSRRALAESVRRRLSPVPGCELRERVATFAEELRMLATDLEDESLSLDPVCAARCNQLLNNYAASPLLNDLLPADDIGPWIRRIRVGFEPR